MAEQQLVILLQTMGTCLVLALILTISLTIIYHIRRKDELD